MADLNGIRQSVNHAWVLLNRTGFMDSSRGMNTEYWQRNKRNAIRELHEAKRALVRSNNLDAYGEISSRLRQLLWQSILAAASPQIGVLIISTLGGRFRDMAEHVRLADDVMSRAHKGFSNPILHRYTAIILNACPTQETIVEQAAARSGDPMPSMISAEDGELYNRIILRAITLSNREQRSHRNAGEAALEAFAGSFLPSLSPADWTSDEIQGRGLTIALGERVADRAGAVISIVSTINNAINAHSRQNNREASINHWVFQVCITESHNDRVVAQTLRRRLHRISQQMNTWLEWLERHHEHPLYVPPGGVIEASPRASLNSQEYTRPGSINRSGPVRGSIRSAGVRGITGLT